MGHGTDRPEGVRLGAEVIARPPAPGARRTGDLRFQVENLTRVEGEGSLQLLVREGVVEEARLQIFEAPRYFEALVAGRSPDEVLDIVARICGICPVAYQMSAVHAFEDLFGVEVEPSTRALRRLLYCAEWIESHALHVYLLHAPDFLGYPSAVELALDHRELVADGLRLKQVGNRLLTTLGGRPIHPVSVRVGGWSRVPRRAELAALRPALDDALRLARATVEVALSLEPPVFEREPRLVALRHAAEYPMNEGRIVSTDGLDLAPGAWGEAFHEVQVPWSNALQARGTDELPYLLGPSARIVLDHDRLHPLAREALVASGALESIRRNPYRSIVARAIELVHATAEAIDLVDTYVPPDAPAVAWQPRPGIAAWATEAPRGLLFHRYEVGADGLVAAASIVPPTSQNQAAIEADIATFAPRVLDLPMDAATHALEQLIRSYDPCISCATHFLDLRIDGRVGPVSPLRRPQPERR
ncbi:MAG TPA: Ni/Fe hydrogenase subunit alpha [Candidatus Limnocylindrales bacterium]|nr:Ni/Fe hydrogenase subunit alpha [Candidatus Limnocylindrales bacterium]